MSPGKISQRVISERLKWIDQMIREIQSLPLSNYSSFTGDKRNIWSAESCLRRAIEALMDLGRHILAKGFGYGVSEYKEIGSLLDELGVLNKKASEGFKTLAGYRNRMVHFYHEISDKELYEICSHQLIDISFVSDTMKGWINKHPDMVDDEL
jgi:uncharacterized protein YutE (UPF0331/DUF86 family)